MQITHFCTSVGVTDAPPNGVKPLLSTSVSDFLPDGVGEKIGRAEDQPYRPIYAPLWEQVSTKPAAAGGSRLTAQIFI